MADVLARPRTLWYIIVWHLTTPPPWIRVFVEVVNCGLTVGGCGTCRISASRVSCARDKYDSREGNIRHGRPCGLSDARRGQDHRDRNAGNRRLHAERLRRQFRQGSHDAASAVGKGKGLGPAQAVEP